MTAQRRGVVRTALWLTAAILMIAAIPASGRPYNGEVVSIRQPDGSFVDVRVWGDEFYAVGETLDGYTVTRDPESGMHSYARLSADGASLVSTGVPAAESPPAGLEKHIRISDDARRDQARTSREGFEQRAFEGPFAPRARAAGRPTAGAVQGITLIIDFDDDPATIASSAIEDYCNLPGYTGYGNHGSVRDYFFEVSDENLEYTNFVPDHYFRASRSKAYYTDPLAPYGQRARELIHEALVDLNNSGFDFSLYDADDNGIIDALNCFYAGGIWNNWAQGLWPHAGWMEYCADGVCTQRYQITNLGNTLALGTFCHENGHMLMGWPDLYDYDGDSSGVGVYCLMSGGGFGTNPVEPCAYMKYIAGWGDVTEPTQLQSDLPVASDSNVIYKFNHPTLSNEYYLIENRQRVDRDANLTDDGIAIWHIDTDGNNSNQQQTPELHYLVTLVQADGRWDLEHDANNGDGTDLYAAPQFTDCTPYTHPNTHWWDGSPSGLSFTNISTSGTVMTFDFEDQPPPIPQNVTAVGEELSVSLKWNSVPVADLDRYVVERDTTDLFGAGTVSASVVDTAYVDGPLPSGVEHYYRVSAVDLAGQAGDPSATVSAVPLPDVAPSAPVDLEALGGGGVITLKWPENPEVDVIGYHVLRCIEPSFAEPDTLEVATAGTCTDSTCAPGTSYWYSLIAEDAAGNLSEPSAPAAGIGVSGDAVFVDQTNSGAQNGSYTNPFRTLPIAIFAADPNDVVIVYPGEYTLPIELKDQVPVIGMRGAATTSMTAAVTAIGIGAETVFKGFRLDGGGAIATGLDLFGCDLSVEDCEFANMTNAGVSTHGGGSPLIVRSLFAGSQTGLTCSDTSAPILNSNTFQGNSLAHIFTSGDPGPYVGIGLAGANDFLDHGSFTIFNTGAATIAAEYNYWGDNCAESSWFTGPVDYTPWTDATHTAEFFECGTGVPEDVIPRVAFAGPSFPNPSRHETSIAFGLPSPEGATSLRIYSAAGRLVRTLVDGPVPAGRHVAHWDGNDDRGKRVSSGVYFFRLTAGGFEGTGKMVRLR
jgi:M6 family metalloprotease-like protein